MDVYAQVAAFYEAEYGPLETDIACFARHAVGGRLLVLGCGTGRVCRAFRDRPVTGLDLSAAMLEIARARAPWVEWVQGDMKHFELGTFGEILVPNAAFAFLRTRADQQRCLAACHAALRPGGTLTIDLPMPDFAKLGTARSPETIAWEGEIGDHRVRRTRETWRYPAEQRIELIDRYYVDGENVATSPLRLRLVFPAEVEWMLEAAGFYVDALYGDYREQRVRDGCPRLLVRAQRA